MNQRIIMTGSILAVVCCGLGGCGSDDGAPLTGPGTPSDTALIRLSEIDPQNDRIELINRGDRTVDVAGLWLCARGAYQQLGDATVISGSLNLLPDSYLVVSSSTVPLDAADSDVGLYRSAAFTDSDAIIDYVQYGAADQLRESVAVDAGIWVAGAFEDVPAADESLAWFGPGQGPAAWGIGMPTFGSDNRPPGGADPVDSLLRLTEVDPAGDRVEIWNSSVAAVDLSDHWLCADGQYQQVGTARVISGSVTSLPADGYLVIEAGSARLSDMGSDLGLFNRAAFSDPAALLDYVQYGSTGNAGESVAIAAGLWRRETAVARPADGRHLTWIGPDHGPSAWDDLPPSLGGPGDRLPRQGLLLDQ